MIVWKAGEPSNESLLDVHSFDGGYNHRAAYSSR